MAREANEPPHSSSAQIVDIRHGADFVPLTDQIRQGLDVPDGQDKKLPTLLLYDKRGLQLFEKITYLDEYYLTNQEISVLEENADRIAQRVGTQSDSVILELGSGNLRKVRILLNALDRKGVPVSYYALDLSREELERTLAEIPPGTFKNVKCYGLWGTYDDGLAWLQQPENLKRPKTILSLGSSIGNFNRKEAADFLVQFRNVLGENDSFLLAIDACTDPKKVYHAYNDRFGLTHEFVLNGLEHANRLLDRKVFNVSDWEVIGEYDAVAGRHHAFVSPKKDTVIQGVQIKAGERIRIEESYKYDPSQSQHLFEAAGITEGAKWTNSAGDYALHLLNRPKVQCITDPEQYATHPVPSLDEYKALWTAWDAVTRDMIPEDELLGKPIKLRNACIFYLGHIPGFLDIHLTRATSSPPTSPANFQDMFERGIDPDVDDPEKCHAHSEIPDEWPPVNDILSYQQRVRTRVQDLYTSGRAYSDPAVMRALWLGLEHEVMHLETLLYMLVQSEKTLPPPSTIMPDFAALAKEAAAKAVPNEWFDVPAQEIPIGIDDPDDNSGPAHYFGWDNERPARNVSVGSFKIQARPITNGEYAAFLEKTGQKGMPASWYEPTAGASKHANRVSNGQLNGTIDGQQDGYALGPSHSFLNGRAVRTVYGPVPLAYAQDWPVSASYDELTACAKYMGGRIPSFEEARSAYHFVETQKSLQARSETIPAVNSHLVNDGVQETPPAKQQVNGGGGHLRHDSKMSDAAQSPPPATTAAAKGDPRPRDLFIDLAGTNTGFKHWHPMPVTHRGNTLGGQCDMGGLWEWTSTTLDRHDGFEPMSLYPGYTADFFDGKHNIVLGGSWATLPRVAGRKSFVNWYQRNYPYVWAGARLVKDVK